MQNEVNLDAIAYYSKALSELTEENLAVKQELYAILRNSDCSEDTIARVSLLLRHYEGNSTELAKAVKYEQERQMTTMQKILKKIF